MAEEHRTKPEDRPLGQAPRPDDRKNPENAKEKIDERLDDALEETFPSSDPVSVKVTK